MAPACSYRSYWKRSPRLGIRKSSLAGHCILIPPWIFAVLLAAPISSPCCLLLLALTPSQAGSTSSWVMANKTEANVLDRDMSTKEKAQKEGQMQIWKSREHLATGSDTFELLWHCVNSAQQEIPACPSDGLPGAPTDFSVGRGHPDPEHLQNWSSF